MTVSRWDKNREPSLFEIKEELKKEGLASYLYQDGIGAYYPTHTHPYDEIRWVVSGSVTFGVEGEEVTLYPGDRLDIPANTPHYARMSDQTPTTYLCASKE